MSKIFPCDFPNTFSLARRQKSSKEIRSWTTQLGFIFAGKCLTFIPPKKFREKYNSLITFFRLCQFWVFYEPLRLYRNLICFSAKRFTSGYFFAHNFSKQTFKLQVDRRNFDLEFLRHLPFRMAADLLKMQSCAWKKMSCQLVKATASFFRQPKIIFHWTLFVLANIMYP